MQQATSETTPGILSLFRAYPQIQNRLPYVRLGRFPTPVEKLDAVGRELGLDRLYIKRDDLSGGIYGGNKVRKLEFLLADALQAGAEEVITMGFAGSNHALATAIYARQLGLKCTSLLMPQPNAHYLRRNLLASHAAGAVLKLYPNLLALIVCGIYWNMLKGKARHGKFPKFIPGGGSSPLGIVGYVNAAFELKEQIDAGLMPEPDLIYVPMGSMGTAAGLTLGLRAAGLRTRVVAVRVIESTLANLSKMLRLTRRTAALLHRSDPAFPHLNFTPDDFTVRHEFIGKGYAHFTEQGAAALMLMRDKAGVPMIGTYSAKAFAAIMADAGHGELKDKTILFWNTFNSRDLSPMIAGVDYHHLPKVFHPYFERDVQPLDRDA